MDPFDLLIPLAVALGVSALMTPVAARIARTWDVIDRPNERKVSQRLEMPLLGGVAVAAGFGIGLLVALQRFGTGEPGEGGSLAGLVIGGALILCMGVLDDRFGLSAWPKFSVQIFAAAIAISHGFQIDHVTDPVSRTLYEFPEWLIWIVTGTWIVGITNATNLIDGLDGLATGVSAIIGATLTAIAVQAGQPLGICIGVALVGALLGFLPFNFAPARIFLGDTGALFIGFVLALLALEGYRRVTVLTFVVPLLALAVPILDVVLSIVRRVRMRTPLFSADRQHMHHRLLETHGSPRSAVLQFYFVTACFCLIALSFTRLQGYTAALFLAAVVVLTLRLLWNLGVFSLSPSQSPVPEVPSLEELQEGVKENES
jgi:UDP-GlcNAc:undecaprenyl-phosphate GlcNAc-1-phosphate transferase